MPRMPVSSSTSRTAASSAVSPASTWPLGSDQTSRPRRSWRAMSAARAPAAARSTHEAAGRGLLDACAAAGAAGVRGGSGAARRAECGQGSRTCARATAAGAGDAYAVLTCPRRRPPPRRADRTGVQRRAVRRAGRGVAAGRRRARARGSPRPGTSWPWSAGRCATRCSAGSATDLDFTTDARPERGARRSLDGLGRRASGTSASRFGTIGARKGESRGRDHDLPRRGLRPRRRASPR